MKIGQSLIVIFCSVLCVAGVVTLQERQLQQKESAKNNSYFTEEKSDRVFLDLQKRMPTFGFDNLLADWNYLGFIQYFGDTPAREQTGYSLVPEFFEVIVKNDPRFIRAGLFLSTANSLFAARPDITVKLLNQVLGKIEPQLDPLAPYVWSYKGIDEILFLGKIEEAKHSYQMAAQWALARKEPDSQEVAQRNLATAQFLETNPDSKRAQVSAWAMILGGAIDEQTQKRAVEEIRALGGQVTVTPQGRLTVTLPEKD
jgi:hypothetical protein